MQCGLIVVSIKVNGAQSDGTPTNKNDSEIIWGKHSRNSSWCWLQKGPGAASWAMHIVAGLSMDSQPVQKYYYCLTPSYSLKGLSSKQAEIIIKENLFLTSGCVFAVPNVGLRKS